jgi:hypothetical protein
VKRSSHPFEILAGIAFLIVVFTLYEASTKLLLFHDTELSRPDGRAY